MKEITHADKPNEIFSVSQFDARNGQIDDLRIKAEKVKNSRQLMKQGKISKRFMAVFGQQDCNRTGFMDLVK